MIPWTVVLFYLLLLFQASCNCLNGGWCTEGGLCDCNELQAHGDRCQIIPNMGQDRDGICRSWGQHHYESFDGIYYYFPGTCSYILAKDCHATEPQYTIWVHNSRDCEGSVYSCHRSLSLFFPNEAEIHVIGHEVKKGNIRLTLPLTIGNVFMERLADYILVKSTFGFSLAWDGSSGVYIKMTEEHKGRPCGLCGNYNDDGADDLTTSYNVQTEDTAHFGNSWVVQLPSEAPCQPLEEDFPGPCSSESAMEDALEKCTAILFFPFVSCHENIDPNPYVASCASDLCVSEDDDTFCRAVTEYTRACSHAGYPVREWRESFPACTDGCDNSFVHRDCISCCPPTCTFERECLGSNLHCLDGCYCPDGDVVVSKVTSLFTQLKTSFGLRVQFDRGGGRLYVQVESSWEGGIVGLCGTFNGNLRDDFLSPSGMIEGTPQLHANAWKVSAACTSPVNIPIIDPCEMNQQNVFYASQCDIINEGLFSPCHSYVSPSVYFQQCRYQACKCGSNCLCTALAHYAYICAKHKVFVNFRAHVSECGMVCLGGMMYHSCTSTCGKTCLSLSNNEACDDDCAEGCNCAEGLYYDEARQRCVADLCRNGRMECAPEEPEPDPGECPPGKTYFNCRDHQPGQPRTGIACEVTCRNLMLNLTCPPATPCVRGCGCPAGLVRHKQECYFPESCPCAWLALEYLPGEVVSTPCYKCVCHRGFFNCTHYPCPSVCTVYSDRHYHTFDGLEYDYVSDCQVYLVKSISGTEVSITAQNKDCYESGIICMKYLVIFVGLTKIYFIDNSGDPSSSSVIGKGYEFQLWKAGYYTVVHFPKQEITILWDKKTTVHIQAGPEWKEFQLWKAGYYTVVHFPKQEITILWDKKTTVHIQAGPEWKGLLTGMCGNFDKNTVNDMTTASNMEVSNAQALGDSWALGQCESDYVVKRPCEGDLIRQPYAKRECAILYSDAFASCHNVVDVTWFYKNCLTDTCNCNRGGDCECLCTSIAAYAHKCCQQGVAVNWRSPTVCSYDCEYYNRELGDGPYIVYNSAYNDTVFGANLTSGEVFPLPRISAEGKVLFNFMIIAGLYKDRYSRGYDNMFFTGLPVISFESAERPNYFLCASEDGSLRLEQWSASEKFRRQATYFHHQGLGMAGYSSFELYSQKGFFITLTRTAARALGYDYSEEFKHISSFTIEDSSTVIPYRMMCEWRYHSCASPCVKTCSDPDAIECQFLPLVEGCFPHCPKSMILDEVTRRCVYPEDCIILPPTPTPYMFVTKSNRTTAAPTTTSATTTAFTTPTVTETETTSTATSTTEHSTAATTTSYATVMTTTASTLVPLSPLTPVATLSTSPSVSTVQTSTVTESPTTPPFLTTSRITSALSTLSSEDTRMTSTMTITSQPEVLTTEVGTTTQAPLSTVTSEVPPTSRATTTSEGTVYTSVSIFSTKGPSTLQPTIVTEPFTTTALVTAATSVSSPTPYSMSSAVTETTPVTTGATTAATTELPSSSTELKTTLSTVSESQQTTTVQTADSGRTSPSLPDTTAFMTTTEVSTPALTSTTVVPVPPFPLTSEVTHTSLATSVPSTVTETTPPGLFTGSITTALSTTETPIEVETSTQMVTTATPPSTNTTLTDHATYSTVIPSILQPTSTCTPPYSYRVDECSEYICFNGHLMFHNASLQCQNNVSQPNCGILGMPVQINKDNCCPQWECPCRCSIISDLRVITFDGNNVALYDNGSYILVHLPRENIVAHIEKCPTSETPTGGTSGLCFKKLNITTHSYKVLINRLERKVSVNFINARLPFTRQSLHIDDTGTMYVINTPGGVSIQWYHSTGIIVLQYSPPYNTTSGTRGLCGCCDGNPEDDLKLPNGTVIKNVEDIPVFLYSWMVHTSEETDYFRRVGDNCTTGNCTKCFQMLNQNPFTVCHDKVSPEQFCDKIWAGDLHYKNHECDFLAAYVAICYTHNICTNWRTPEFCPLKCPPGKEYQACVSTCKTKTCQNREYYEESTCSYIREECVCKSGTILHRADSAFCVTEEQCVCTDNEGGPRAPGEVWKGSSKGCCMYKCMENGSIIAVEPECSEVPSPICEREGEYVIDVIEEGACCPKKICECNLTICDNEVPACENGNKLMIGYSTISCCPDYRCECDSLACPTATPPECREDQFLVEVREDKSCCYSYLCVCESCIDPIPLCSEGEILAVDLNTTHHCCPQYQCVCDVNLCPVAHADCTPGTVLVKKSITGQCCPEWECECSCQNNSVPFCQVGETHVEDPDFSSACGCTRYFCSKFAGGGGQSLPFKLHHQVYVPSSDPHICCGSCKNVSCTFTNENGTIDLYRAGSTWVSNCTRFDCVESAVGAVVLGSGVVCPPFNDTECVQNGGTVQSYIDGCCKTCKDDGRTCKKVTIRTTIRKDDCRSSTPVTVTSCDGKCPSATIFNFNINSHARFCKCCRESGLETRTVQLYCSRNSTLVDYVFQEPTDCTSSCPQGWVPFKSSCYKTGKGIEQWSAAQKSCELSLQRAHLADIETEEEYLFISSYLKTFNHMIMLWIGLNDKQTEGELRWTDGSAYNLGNVMTSNLPHNETDCYALQMNATGPNYFFTGFFCYIPLPYLCEYEWPNPPLNAAVKTITSREIPLYWTAPDKSQDASFDHYLISYVDVQTNKKETLVVENYKTSAVIPSIKPYHPYRISIQTVTAAGSGSCVDASISVITGVSPPNSVSIYLEDVGEENVTLQWDPPQEQIDEYYILVRSVTIGGDSKNYSVNNSNSFELSMLTPGMTYEIGVAAVRNGNMSELKTIQQTLRPKRVQIVVPYELNTHSVVLYVQKPHAGIYDGINVTYKEGSQRTPVSVGGDTITIENLTPGTAYDFFVYTTSVNMASAAYQVPAVKTYPDPPLDVQFIEQDENSVYVSWKQPRGLVDGYKDWLNYTATDLVPGSVYNITVQRVSEGVNGVPAFVTVTTVPERPQELQVMNTSSSSFSLRWRTPYGHVDRYQVDLIPDQGFVTVTELGGGELQVAAENSAGSGLFSSSILFKTAESVPGLVTNLTASAYNHTTVKVTWFLPRRPNGLITKFLINVKHARSGQLERKFEINAEEIMKGTLPNCHDDAEFYSGSTPSPATSSASPPLTSAFSSMTASALPAQFSWTKPITLIVEQLKSYTAYVFEVSAFTNEGEGLIASYMVRMPESVPEDPPQSIAMWNISSKSFTISWDPPTVQTGKFNYRIELYGPSGHIFDNSTRDLKFTYSGLTPYTTYTVFVGAETFAGPGPKTNVTLVTPAEAPSAVNDLKALAVDSTSVKLSWKSPLQPNGIITQYRILVFRKPPGILVQNITLTGKTEDLNDSTLVNDAESTSVLVTNLSAEQMSHVIKTLIPFTEYVFSVAASTDVGEGPSTNISVKTREQVPSSVQGVYYQNITSTSILVSWKPPTNPNGKITHFTVYGMELLTKEAFHKVTNETSIIISGLKKYTEYKLRVAASTSVGESSLSEEDDIFARTMEDEPESAPQNLTVQHVTASTAVISWLPPEKPNGIITYYKVTYAVDTDFHTENSTTTTVTLQNLKPHSVYNISIRAYTKYGHGNQTSSVLKVLTGEDAPGSPPFNLTYESISSTKVEVSWISPLHANGIILSYTIEYWNASHSLNISSNRTTAILSNLRKYTQYWVTVSANTKFGNGNQTSDILNVTTLEDEVTTNKTDLLIEDLQKYTGYILKVTPATAAGFSENTTATLYITTDEDTPETPPVITTYKNLTASSIQLFWNPPAQPNGNILLYNLVIHGPTGTNSSSTSHTSLILSGLLPSTTYNVSINAETSKGPGPSATQLLYTDETEPSASPQNLVMVNHTADTVWLRWDPSPEPNGVVQIYSFKIFENNSQTISYKNTSGLFTDAQLTGFKPHSVYLISVSAFTKAGNGNLFSNSVSFSTNQSVPSAPKDLNITKIQSSSVTLSWTRPDVVPGYLQNYRIVGQLLSMLCNNWNTSGCIENKVVQYVSGTDDSLETSIYSLLKFRRYRFSVAASTNAGYGNSTDWISTNTLPGNPDTPPQNVTAVSRSYHTIDISWRAPEVVAGPTAYLIDVTSVDSQDYNRTFMKRDEESKNIELSDLTQFTRYSVIVIAFTGDVNEARIYGKASAPVIVTTLQDTPKDPPKNVTLQKIPDDVTKVYVMFSPPSEPNGDIQFYRAVVYKEEDPTDIEILDLRIIENNTDSLTAVIEGLKGGHTYNISVYAVNGAGPGPKTELKITMDIQAPPESSMIPVPAYDKHGAAIITARTMTIQMPVCFFSDSHGPIEKIQVIIAEAKVRNDGNITTWKDAYFNKPRPYFSNKGFENPPCTERMKRQTTSVGTYVLGAEDTCMSEGNEEQFCNGPLKPKKDYVFKFRATNFKGQYTDSVYSKIVTTAGEGLSSRTVEIILAVALCVLSVILLGAAIYAFARIRQKQKEGGTYSPRDAETIDTKFKLDQLITVADLELKEEKLTRYSSFFFRRKEIFVIQPVNKKSFLQHVEDLCSNDNVKFQEEFSELPKLLQDLATSDADLPWNRSKNRFTNIKPYNNNRVKLISEAGVPGSDYINASYVSAQYMFLHQCALDLLSSKGNSQSIWFVNYSALEKMDSLEAMEGLEVVRAALECNSPVWSHRNSYYSHELQNVFPSERGPAVSSLECLSSIVDRLSSSNQCGLAVRDSSSALSPTSTDSLPSTPGTPPTKPVYHVL
ncbi:Phosphatidylinositol phosphatase PTPRQ [Acipenser ruthenus]|uniref:Phosphatidylinositol phosphatase PTPRQ n=1 Tax=Acipenser ruthenus TaxID=7906 RepID=A0A662YRC4_ACIRT|nr:Phosphatidylinositol phosphatase PTPRQ [Acipenser ruthenus]